MSGDLAAARRFIRDRRRQERGHLGVLELYGLGFTAVLAVAMSAGPVGRFMSTVDAGDVTNRWPALLAAAGLGGFAVLLSFGPVVLSPAQARWLLLSPLGRRALLARPVVVVFAACAVVGAVVGLAAAAVLGGPVHVLVAAVAAGAATGVGGAAVAVIAQPVPAAAAVLSDLVHGGLLLAVAVFVAPAVGRLLRPFVAGVDATSLALGLVVGAGVLVPVAWRRLARFPAAAVSDAARLAGARIDAVVGLEPRYLVQVGERRYWHGRRLRSRSWPRLPAPLVVAWQEVRTLRRRPARLALLAASTAVPAAVAEVFGAVSPVAVLVGGTAAALAAVSGARHDAEHPAATRWLAVPPGAVLAARSGLPTVLAAAWMVAALAALGHGDWWPIAPAAAPALAAAAIRMARRRPIAHASTPIVFPMTGTWVPSGWLIWTYSGVDLALIGTAPALVTLVGGTAPTTAVLVVQAVIGIATLAAYLTGAVAFPPSTGPR